MQPDLAFTDLEALLKGLGEEFDAVATNANLDFRVHTLPALVRTDQRMLTRIVRNLLSNAFRYTRTGGVLLGLRRRGDRLRIEVWDTGVGIEADKLRDIFTEFHQLLPQGTGGRQGVGLGLAIVERMVRVLGYDIDVASQPGKGSRFMVSLPLEQAREQPSVSQPQGAAAFESGFNGARILVIDNEPAVLESMRLLLEQWGCSVLTASGETAALTQLGSLAAETAPDVILADYHLDDNLTGCEAIHAVRRKLGRDIPAAVITADRSDDTRRLMRAQYLPILNKPVKPNRLRALLTSLLSTA